MTVFYLFLLAMEDFLKGIFISSGNINQLSSCKCRKFEREVDFAAGIITESLFY